MLTLALVVGFVTGIVWYLHHRLTYWQRKGVPTPGLSYQLLYYTRELATYDMELRQKYGPVFGVMEGLKPILIVSDLDLIRDVLIKDFSSFPNHKPLRVGDSTVDMNLFSLDGNDDWKRIRSLLSPTFTSGKLRSMEGLVNSCIEGFKKNLGAAADSGELIDSKRYFNALSFDVIARCAYATRIDSLTNPDSPMQKNFESMFSENWAFIFALFFPKFATLTGIKKRALRPFNFLVSMTKSLIDERSKLTSTLNGAKSDYNDFLQTMIDANREAVNESVVQSQTAQQKKTLSTDEMTAQAMVFLLAGFDTTATAMATSAYHLAKNPEVQEKLIAEVSSLTECTHDTVMSLKYLEAFIKESFRVTPPGVRIERECITPTLLGNIEVEPGTIVSIPVFPVHRDPTQYKNPDRFDPDRFIDGESEKRHPSAFIPFGGGPRMCIAKRFAEMEVKLALAQILKDYHFEAAPETKLEFIPASLDALAPRPIMLRVRKH